MTKSDFIKVTVEEKTGEPNKAFTFEVKVDFFSVTSKTSMGFIKLQVWRSTIMDEERGFGLKYIDWKTKKKCLFTSTENPEISLTPLNFTLSIRPSTGGRLNVKLNGNDMILDGKCEVDDMWSRVNRVKVTLLDKTLFTKPAIELFKLNYEIYQVISKLTFSLIIGTTNFGHLILIAVK